MSAGRFLGSLGVGVALGGVVLLLPLTARALSPFQVGPQTSGIVAIEVSLVMQDRASPSSDAFVRGHDSRWDVEPTLAPADWPCPDNKSRSAPCHYLISPDRKDMLCYFSNLAPGRYQFIQFSASIPTSWLPDGEPYASKMGSRRLVYTCMGRTRELLSMEVAPGSIAYLGRLAIVESRYRRPLSDTHTPYVTAHLVRDPQGAAKALQSLRQLAGGSPWEARLAALPDSALASAPIDTTWEWPPLNVE